KSNTRDMRLPFGDTLSRGNYTVNVELVAEQPISNRIFRARLVAGKQIVAQGPQSGFSKPRTAGERTTRRRLSQTRSAFRRGETKQNRPSTRAPHRQT